MNTKDEDYVEKVFTASTHDVMLFFTTSGRVYWKKAYEIPESGRAARGKALVNFLEIGTDESIADLLCIREFSDEHFLVMATKNGIVKKTCLGAFRNIRAGGIIAIAVDENDVLIGVQLTNGRNELVLSTRNGMSIRFEESQLRDQGRATRRSDAEDALAALSAREREVALLVAEGLGNLDIADRLFVTESTIKKHVHTVYDKLGIRTRPQLVAWAWRTGVLQPDGD